MKAKQKVLFTIAVLLAAMTVHAGVANIDLSSAIDTASAASATHTYTDGVLKVDYSDSQGWGIAGVKFPLNNLEVTNISFEYLGDNSAEEWVTLVVYLEDSEGGLWWDSNADLSVSMWDSVWNSSSFMPHDVLFETTSNSEPVLPFKSLGFVANPSMATSASFSIRNVQITSNGEYTPPSSQDGTQKVQIGDLYYNLNDADLTAEVAQSDNSYEGLTDIDIPASVTYNDVQYSVTSIGKQAFEGCGKLVSTTIPNSVISIGQNAFYNCGSLASVTFSSGVTSIADGAFTLCGKLTSITIPNSVTSIGRKAFGYCGGLTNVVVDSDNNVFDSRDHCNAVVETATNTLVVGCSATTIPNGVTSIGIDAFNGISSLTSITIPNSVTSIAGGAFWGCSGLKIVVIGSGITSIGGHAFLCGNLTSFTCNAVTPPTLDDNTFYSVDRSIPFYVPSRSVAAYQAAEGWSEFTNIQAIQTQAPMFPDDPGTLTMSLELKAAVMDGEDIQGYEPTGGGGYAKGSSVTITAQDIPGYAFVQWSDEVTDKSRTIVLDESMTLTAYYTHSMIEIPIAAGKWNFICLPPLGDRQYTEDMFTYDGLSDVQWGTYNGAKRAAGQSGWETPESFNAMHGYILYSSTAGTLRINAYQDEIGQGQAGSAMYAGMSDYASNHAENANWNFVGNPYSQGYSIAGFAAAGIESPITVWNGTAYSTYTPGIDDYTLQPFQAFFIQKAEGGAESLPFNSEYLVETSNNSGNGNSGSAIEGELPGAFSVAEGRQVHFSRGNLQYQASTDTWRFAENQYDYVGEANANISSTYDGWIDLFGWGTGNNPTLSSDNNADYNTFVDWGTNAISNGSDKANLWRTLTTDEWGYLFQARNNASALYGLATINGINGMIILPDDWQSLAEISFISGIEDYSQNTYSLEQWSSLESAGAVFLPSSGAYLSVAYGERSSGYYWSSSPFGNESGDHVRIKANNFYPQYSSYCKYRFSVRLVR